MPTPDVQWKRNNGSASMIRRQKLNSPARYAPAQGPLGLAPAPPPDMRRHRGRWAWRRHRQQAGPDREVEQAVNSPHGRSPEGGRGLPEGQVMRGGSGRTVLFLFENVPAGRRSARSDRPAAAYLPPPPATTGSSG